jgi:hypothetical protein
MLTRCELQCVILVQMKSIEDVKNNIHVVLDKGLHMIWCAMLLERYSPVLSRRRTSEATVCSEVEIFINTASSGSRNLFKFHTHTWDSTNKYSFILNATSSRTALRQIRETAQSYATPVSYLCFSLPNTSYLRDKFFLSEVICDSCWRVWALHLKRLLCSVHEDRKLVYEYVYFSHQVTRL